MELLKVKEIAKIMNVTPKMIYDLHRKWMLKFVKVGRGTRIERSELERYIVDNTK